MDLDKAIDILRGPYTEDGGGDPQTRRQKIETARAVVEYIVTDNARRTILDYTARAGAIFEGLCYMHGDSDTSVWMAADEGIVKLLKLLTPEYTSLFCGLLISVMSSPPGVTFVPPMRTLKLAIKRFSEVCHMINSAHVGDYVCPTVFALSAFAATRDEGLLEIVSQCVGAVYRTLAWAMDSSQAEALNRAFLPLLTDPSAQIRRYAAAILAALAENYPRPRYRELVDALPCWPKETINDNNNNENVPTAAARHGALLCVLGLVRIRTRDAMFLDDEGDPVNGVLDRIVPLCSECLGVEDNTLIGAAAEALSQTLSDHGARGFMWEGARGARGGIWDVATEALLRVVFASKAARVGSRSAAVACLALLYRYRPAETHCALLRWEEVLEGRQQQQEEEEEEGGSCKMRGAVAAALEGEKDPMFSGNVAALLAEAVVAHVALRRREAREEEEEEDCEEEAFRAVFGAGGVAEVLGAITAYFRARSSVTARMGCAALSRCVGALMRSALPEDRRSAMAAVAAFLGTGAEAYWLVKLEVAGALAAVDYQALWALEGALEESHLCGNIQRQALDFILGLLDSNDARVRHGAAVALAQIAEHLWLPPQPESAAPAAGLGSSSGAGAAVWPRLPAQRCARGIQLVMSLLIQRTLILHPQTQLKGVYHALSVVAARFGALYPALPGREEFSAAPNPLCSYATELMPLIVERLAGGSPLALDLDCHIDALRLVAALAREGAEFMARFSARVFVHCLKLLNALCFVSTTRTPPPCPLRDLTPNHPYFLQNRISNNFTGNFYTSQGYVDMYARLYNTYLSGLTTIAAPAQGPPQDPASVAAISPAAAGSEFQSTDKFGDLRAAVLHALAMTIRCIGPSVASQADEILAYMQILYIQDKDHVVRCTGELFQVLFMHSLPQGNLANANGNDGDGTGRKKGKAGAAAENSSSSSNNNNNNNSIADDEKIFAGWSFEKYEIGPVKAKTLSNRKDLADSRDAYIKFEPLVIGMLETYHTSNSGRTRSLILQFLTLLIKGGIFYDDIDPNGDFLRTVLGQCSSDSKKYLFFNNPAETLPALFEFLFVLYAVDAHFTRELTGAALINLALCHASEGRVTSYSRTAALTALTATLPALFCRRALGMPLIRHTKEQLFRAVLAQFPRPQAVDFVVKFLFLARAHHASWQAFSRLAYAPAQALFQGYSRGHHLRTTEDLWRLCSLWAVISPKGFSLDAWLKILSDARGNGAAEESPLSPETELGRALEALGLGWIPAFLGVARHALSVPAEALLPQKKGEGEGNGEGDGNSDILCKVAGAATAAVKKYAETKWCVQLPGVADSVALVTAAAESLVRRMAGAVEGTEIRREALGAALGAFEGVLGMDDIVAVVKPFGSLVRLLSGLCPGGGNAAALAFYHGVLAKKFAGEGGGERTSRNARESSLNVWLLGELAYFMKAAGTSAAAAMEEEPFAVDENVLAKLFQNRTFIKTRLADLKCVFENEANTDTVLAAALRCITPSVTNRGARNFLAVVAHLPRSLKLTQFLCERLIVCEVSTLKRGLLKVLARNLEPLGITQESQVHELYKSFSDKFTATYKYKAFRGALADLLSIDAKGALPQSDRPSDAYDEDMKIATIDRGDFVKYIDGSRFISLLVALGGSYFTDMLFAGEFDWALHDFIGSEGSHVVRYNICRYLRERMSKKLSSGVAGPVSSSQWHKEVLLCSSLSTFATKYHRVLRTLVQPEDQIELATHVLSQFNAQWRAAASSPFDLVAIFTFTALSLFDLAPEHFSREPSQPPSSPSTTSATTATLSPVLARLVPPLYEAYRLTVLSQDLQAHTLVEHAVAEAPPEGRTEAMLRGLASGLLLSDLYGKCHFGKSFATAVIALLLTLARKFPGLLFPLKTPGGGGSGGAGHPGMGPMAEDLPLYQMCQQSESPELTLRTALHFLTTVGVEDEGQFRAVYCALRTLVTAADAGELGVSEELQCLALRGATSLVVKACLHDSKEDRLRAVSAATLFPEQREYAVARAKLVNQMMPLEEAIAIAAAAPTAPAFARTVGLFAAAPANAPVPVSSSPSAASVAPQGDDALPLRPQPLQVSVNGSAGGEGSSGALGVDGSSCGGSDLSLSSSQSPTLAAAGDVFGYDEAGAKKAPVSIIREKISLLLTSSASASASAAAATSDDGGDGECGGGEGAASGNPLDPGCWRQLPSPSGSWDSVDLFGVAPPGRKDRARLRWKGVDMAPAVAELLGILGGILNAQGPSDDALPGAADLALHPVSPTTSSLQFSPTAGFSPAPTPTPYGSSGGGASNVAAVMPVAATFTVPLSFLQTEAVYSLVLVADLLSGEQIRWLLGLFKQLFTALSSGGNGGNGGNGSPDFVLMSCLVHGILKCAALVPAPDQSVSKLVSDVIHYALESAAAAGGASSSAAGSIGGGGSGGGAGDLSGLDSGAAGAGVGAAGTGPAGAGEHVDKAGSAVALAALDGLRYFVRCAEPRAYLTSSLVNFVCKYVLTQLAALGREAGGERLFLHTMAAGFNIVRMFPNECDVTGVAQPLLKAAVAMADRRGCSATAAQTIFRGLGGLLVSRSLSLRMRRFLEDFALRKLQGASGHASNSLRSFFAFTLLVAIMYFGRDPFASPAAAVSPSDGATAASSSSSATAQGSLTPTALGGVQAATPGSNSGSISNYNNLGPNDGIGGGGGGMGTSKRNSGRPLSASTRRYDFNAMMMYDMEDDLDPDDGLQTLGSMSEMERIQTLYAAARKSILARHVPALVDILARITVDILPPSQSVPYAVKEFIKKFGSMPAPLSASPMASTLSSLAASVNQGAAAGTGSLASSSPLAANSSARYDRVEMRDSCTMGLVMAKVFALVENKPLVYENVTACLRSTLLVEGYGIWLSSCLLFAASPSPLLNSLFNNIVYTPREDPGLFVLAATEFAAIPEMTSATRKELVEILRETNEVLYVKVSEKIAGMAKTRSAPLREELKI